MDRLAPGVRHGAAGAGSSTSRRTPPTDGRIVVVHRRARRSRARTSPRPWRCSSADAGGDGRKRLADAGLQLVPLGAEVQIGAVKFGSRAQKSGFEQGWRRRRGRGAERPAVAALVLPAGVAARRDRLGRAGPAHARGVAARLKDRHARHEGLRRRSAAALGRHGRHGAPEQRPVLPPRSRRRASGGSRLSASRRCPWGRRRSSPTPRSTSPRR